MKRAAMLSVDSMVRAAQDRCRAGFVSVQRRFVRQLRVAASFAACVTMVPLAAQAQTTPPGDVFVSSKFTNSATAELLFREANELMDERKFRPACDKFAASQQLDPTIGTTLHLADCYEKIGKVASAWSLFRIAEGQARSKQQLERAEVAAERAERLTNRLSYLTLVVSYADLKDLKLTLGDKELPKPAWGTRVPIDPGTTELKVEAPGYKQWSTPVFVRPRGSSRVIVPQLRKVNKSVPVPFRPVEPSVEPAESSSAVTWGWVVGGVGVVALGAGGVLGLRASALNNDSMAECLSDNVCSQRGVELRRDAVNVADMATVALGAGALMIATGSVMLFAFGDSDDDPARDEVANKSDGMALSIQPYVSGLGLQLRGGW